MRLWRRLKDTDNLNIGNFLRKPMEISQNQRTLCVKFELHYLENCVQCPGVLFSITSKHLQYSEKCPRATGDSLTDSECRKDSLQYLYADCVEQFCWYFCAPGLLSSSSGMLEVSIFMKCPHETVIEWWDKLSILGDNKT